MLAKAILSALFFSGLAVAQSSDSSVVGVFVLARHGDRTSKIEGIGIEGSSVLTTLGKNQVYAVGQYLRNKYLNSTSPDYIQNISSNYVASQFYVSAPNDQVLGLSAIGYVQGIYPPSETATTQTLANGTSEDDPLNGLQYVLVNGMPSDSPDVIWVAGDQSCPAMTKASQAYYNSTKFLTMKTELQPFYDKFQPILTEIFEPSEIGFQNAYNIFDYLNVGYTHNTTIRANLSAEDLYQLRILADSQSFDLNYNVSSPNASIGGKTIAANILSHLNQTVSGSSSAELTTFFGAYSPMLAFWGLTDMPAASVNFTGLPDYASAMAFELRRPAGSTSNDDLFVRFGFRNGSDPSTEITYFPMFGSNETDMPWSQWSAAMANISISSTGAWCSTCGSTLGFCTGAAQSVSASTNPLGTAVGSGSAASNSAAAPSSTSSSGLSNAAAGGIGAGVTIAVIALIEGLVALWYFSTRRSRRASIEKVPSEIGSGPS